MLTFQELYETYAADVYRFALWLSGDSFAAGDITSETFIRAWTHRDAIRTETLKAYLIAIARNLYLEQGRKGRRQVILEDIHTNPGPGPDRVVEAKQEIAKVRQILLTVPEIDRAAFTMRVQHEFPYAEIARVLEISTTAARVKVHRVRKKILIAFSAMEVYS